MPTSLPIFDEELETYFGEVPHESVLDIGAGEGKYGKMLRRLQPQARLIGVEIDPDYVERYQLRSIYDDVRIQDAAALMDDPQQSFSAVIIGDCIEHMRKSAGVDLLNFLVYRSRIIILKFPVQFAQNAVHGHRSEAHVSVWSRNDFSGFDRVYVEHQDMRLCLIRGYLSQTVDWVPPVVMQRLGYPSMTAYYDAAPERWELADVHGRRRAAAEQELRSVVPASERFILVDEMQSGLLATQPGRWVPFLERQGQYWGMPTGDDDAIAELDRQRAAGLGFIVFAWPSFWALTFYKGLSARLRARHRCALDTERLVVFDVRS
jgi:SAM-dependent methyltransferase